MDKPVGSEPVVMAQLELESRRPPLAVIVSAVNATLLFPVNPETGVVKVKALATVSD